MTDEQTPEHKGVVPKSGEYVSGPGGPTMTQGGIMPGGPEMEGWKRPVKDSLTTEPEGTIEEQAENVRRLADESRRRDDGVS
ncbi:MAG: hypothetical protein AB1673_10470 [Actinomycetota bacterium]|jgi:hypothetical protein